MGTSSTIAVDMMGGDQGPSVTVPAVFAFLEENPQAHVLAFGHRDQMNQHGLRDHPRLIIEHTDEMVAMDESPTVALKRKKHASMRLAIEAVQQGRAHACVSAGNTGALMALARFVLRTPKGVDRPAIMSEIPTKTGKPVLMLDLGANVDNTPRHLLQFAYMGHCAAQALLGCEQPRVALLNIGHEAIKGNELIKETNRLLKQSSLHYIGYLESHHIFDHDADVLICDGFVGNAVLKAFEGTARFLLSQIKSAFQSGFLGLLAGWLFKLTAYRTLQAIHPSRHNGALMLGLQGSVVKSHGGADVQAFCCALNVTLASAQSRLSDQVMHGLQSAELLGEH